MRMVVVGLFKIVVSHRKIRREAKEREALAEKVCVDTGFRSSLAFPCLAPVGHESGSLCLRQS